MFLQKFALMMAPQILLEEDFRQGIDLTISWAITRFPPRFSADDGIVSTSDRGLYVKAAGTNSETGEPAFSESAAGEDDHLKWMIDTQHLSSNSVPGFDAVPGHELQISMRARVRTFGTAAHPFGSAVTNPDTDLRLASFAMNTIDYQTGIVFDIWMTNNAIYPYYERLNLTGTATYGVFSSVFPPVSRRPGEQAKVAVAYDRAAGTVRWLVNDAEAARVSKIGFPAPDATTIIDHGGTPEVIAPRQLNCGGKVAFITGAARGQGRSNAVRLAQEGADIIAVDILSQVGSVHYPMSTPEDLDQTVKEVEALDRRIVASQADVRDYGALKAALDEGVAQLGRLDIVSANAGINSFGRAAELDDMTWQDIYVNGGRPAYDR